MAKRMGDTNCWIRTFEVTEPTKHRKGFTVYKVTSVVFPRAFPESATKITVWKRYSDFHKLHKDLEQIFKQLYLRGEFPVFPKAKLFGRFEHEVVEERRKAALNLLEFTANYTQLFTSKPFMQFFESGYNSQDFIGKILFRKVEESAEDPPVTVLQEKSDIYTPCLKPEILWNDGECPTNDGDSVSLSLSSVSSISPTEGSETPAKTTNQHKPCSSETPSNLVTNPINGESSKEPTAVTTTTTNNGVSNGAILENSPSSSHTQSQPQSSQDKEICVSTSHRPNGIVRSATVTDDFSSYFDEEFEDAAFLFPTGSCSSLDTLPGFTASSDVVDSAQKNIPSSSRGFFTLSRKKSNGFGLFDFLPLFPKKSKTKSVSKEKEEKKEPEPKEKEEIKKTSLSVGYICEAAGHFAVAQFHESNAEYENAFAAYKEGIRVLLAGAQDDVDRDRKLLAKNKLEKYLLRAESLKDNFLSPGTSKCGTISPVFSSPNKREKSLSSLNRNGKNVCSQNGRSLLCNIEELKPYKVIGVGAGRSKILIVMNPEESNPKCYATKVLWKSPSIIYPDKPTVIPCHVPFMVKLLKWFDSEDKIILLLEHAGGGRLEEFVKNYQSKKLSLSTPPEECSPVEGIETTSAEPSAENKAVNSEVNERDCNQPALSNATATESNNLPFETEKEVLSINTNLPENEVVSENEIFSTPAMSPTGNEIPSSNPDNLDDVARLLENSKALLQTVSQTLEAGCSPTRNSFNRECKNDISEVQNPIEDIPSESTNLDSQQVSDESNRKDSNTSIVQLSRKSSDTSDEFEDYLPLRMVPEGVVKVWTAEIVIALEALHGIGITYGDLHINDILLGENGHILLRYKSLWTEVDDKMTWNSYSAPEVRDSVGTPLWKIHPSSDWWSLGAILFVLLTGQTLHAAHPEGIYPEMIIKVPETSVCETPISKSAQTLLKELLQYSPGIRLGYYGAAEIKTHPFFDGFDWEKALEDCRNEEEILVIPTQTTT